MTKIRRRMIEDMNLAGLAPGTHEGYLRSVAQLARHYNTSPDQLSEEQVRRYLLDLLESKCVARGTFTWKSSGLRFFYEQTLGRDWALFGKKKFVRRSRSVCRIPSRMAIFYG